jgi:hypothetical protein
MIVKYTKRCIKNPPVVGHPFIAIFPLFPKIVSINLNVHRLKSSNATRVPISENKIFLDISGFIIYIKKKNIFLILN